MSDQDFREVDTIEEVIDEKDTTVEPTETNHSSEDNKKPTEFCYMCQN